MVVVIRMTRIVATIVSEGVHGATVVLVLVVMRMIPFSCTVVPWPQGLSESRTEMVDSLRRCPPS